MLDHYIERIENNDASLTAIELLGCGRNDNDVNRLMQALSKNPNIAKNIVIIKLFKNNLTSVKISAALIALQELDLSYNNLTSLNIPAELVGLKKLYLGNNQLINFNLPALANLQLIDLSFNRLTSFNMPALTSLNGIRLDHNQLTSINIPALTTLKNLYLYNNKLVSFNCSDKLVALKKLYLDNNQLTNINITALTALEELCLDNNQLTSINIPVELIALKKLYLVNNQLTTLTHLALAALNIAIPTLEIDGINGNIAEQLTPEITQAHFEAMSPVFLSSMNSSLFKCASIQSGQRPTKESLPVELVMMVMDLKGIGPKALLDQNIVMLKRAFSDNKQLTTLLELLTNDHMRGFKKIIIDMQLKKIKEIICEFKKNTEKTEKLQPETKSTLSLLNLNERDRVLTQLFIRNKERWHATKNKTINKNDLLNSLDSASKRVRFEPS